MVRPQTHHQDLRLRHREGGAQRAIRACSRHLVLEWYEAGKRQRKPLTESTLEAQDALRKKTQTLEARSNGLIVVEEKGAKGKVSLETAVREYLEEVKLNRAHKTHLAYKRALGMLVSSNPGCDFVQDLERRNLMVHFIRAMKEAGLRDRRRTICSEPS